MSESCTNLGHARLPSGPRTSPFAFTTMITTTLLTRQMSQAAVCNFPSHGPAAGFNIAFRHGARPMPES
eukprot:3425157-Rhodomonas_salina.2